MTKHGKLIDTFDRYSASRWRVIIHAHLYNNQILYYKDTSSYSCNKDEIFSMYGFIKNKDIEELVKIWINGIENSFNREEKLKVLLDPN